MFETVLIPHGNQIKIIRGVQDRFCELSDGFVPFEPFFMRFDCEPPLDVAESVVARKVQLCGRNVFLLSDVLAGGERFSGRILLGFFLGEGGFPFGAVFPECSFVFPVFKIAKVSSHPTAG